MADLLTELTALSASVFNEQQKDDYCEPLFALLGAPNTSDAVLRESHKASVVLRFWPKAALNR